MRQKPNLRSSEALRALSIALALSASGSAALARVANEASAGLVVTVQATPPVERAPRAEPPAENRAIPGPSDDATPLLTPDIRPQGQVPNLKPDTPERKAEPKLPPPAQKDAQPAPKQTPKPDLRADPKSQLPKNDNPKPSAKSANKAPAAKPGLAVVQPRSAAEREKALSDLYAYLATADDEKQAATVSNSIEKLWVTSGSDTISLLMQRAMAAANGKNPELAIKLLDAVVALAPDYAEGWNRRAYVHYTRNEVEQALGDLRRTLALDPNHFKALDGLIHILKDIGRKKEALQAARRLLDVNPFYEGAKQIVDELSRELEGRGI